MRTVVAVDWSEQSFNAVKVVSRLFMHEELTLIYAVDLRPFENPLFAEPLGRRSADELRRGMVAAGDRLLEQTGALVPSTVPPSKLSVGSEPVSGCVGGDPFVASRLGCGRLTGAGTTFGVVVRQRLASGGAACPLRGPAGQG